jgi:hypothetical protein
VVSETPLNQHVIRDQVGMCTWLSKRPDERPINLIKSDTEGERPNKELEINEGSIEVSKAGSDHH